MTVALAGVLSVVLSAFSAAATVRAKGAQIVVNEVPVLTLRSSVGTSTPTMRAADIAQRLNQLADPVTWQIEHKRRYSTVKANGQLVLRVTETEGKANGSAHPALTRNWVAALRQAWALPPFALSQRALRLPTDGAASVTLRGSSAAAAVVENNNPSVVSVQRTETGLRFQAVARGAARITLSDGERQATVDVEVWPYAARFPQRFSAEVVGEPAIGTVIRRAVERVVRQGFLGEAGVTYRVLSSPVQALGPRGRQVLRWRVRASAPGAFPREGEVLTDVVNLGIKTSPETALWYCNFPEILKGPKPLFQAPLTAGKSARMLYHHVNESGSPLVMQVLVLNSSDRPARLAIIPGDGEPHTDPVRVGLEAGERFLQGWLRHAGEVVTIPAGTALPISMRRLGRNETSSGLCTLMLLPGGPAEVSVQADSVWPASLDGGWLARGQNATPWVTAGARALPVVSSVQRLDSEQIFPRPFRTLDARFEVGQRFLFLRVGEVPIANATASQDLQGNFGVAYTVRTLLVNPRPVATTVQIAFEASAGYSGALFVVNGEVKRAPLLMAKDEFVVKEVRLGPGESRQVSFLTIPLSGSSYPATVIVRPRSSMASVLR